MEVIEIVVDCNSDDVRIITSDGTIEHGVERPVAIRQLLEDIFNAIDFNAPDKSIRLSVIDEDRQTTVGEW